MTADLYDFDGTIFDGESGTEFYLFCLKRHPKIIKYLPRQLKGAIKYILDSSKMIDKFKIDFYSFLPAIDVEREAKLFWEKNAHRMNGWFRPREHDVPAVVCSASPVFQIKPICDRLGVKLIIGTDVDPKTGRMNDINCKGKGKLEYIKKYAPDYTFRDVYTDNIGSDAPLLSLATRDKYKVTKGKIIKL